MPVRCRRCQACTPSATRKPSAAPGSVAIHRQTPDRERRSARAWVCRGAAHNPNAAAGHTARSFASLPCEELSVAWGTNLGLPCPIRFRGSEGAEPLAPQTPPGRSWSTALNCRNLNPSLDLAQACLTSHNRHAVDSFCHFRHPLCLSEPANFTARNRACL